jgi:hypothetical protein
MLQSYKQRITTKCPNEKAQTTIIHHLTIIDWLFLLLVNKLHFDQLGYHLDMAAVLVH